MVIDKWCHNKNLGLEDFFVGVSIYSEEKLQKNYIKIYGTYLKETKTHISSLLLLWSYSLLRTTSESLNKIRQRIRKLQHFEI